MKVKKYTAKEIIEIYHNSMEEGYDTIDGVYYFDQFLDSVVIDEEAGEVTSTIS